MWTKAAAAKGKLVEELRKDVEKTKSEARKWVKDAADKRGQNGCP